MHFFESESQINASPAAVWAVLTDGATWPTWDSGVDGVKGEIAPGNKLTISSAAAPGRAFPVKVTTFDAPKMLVFTGGMPLGLFKGERTYSLTEANGGTLFRMREEYTGLMLPMIWPSIPDLNPSFAQFANGLKKRVEASA
jgi:hypothetical protein